MPFNLINVNEANAVVLNEDGSPLVFEDGRAAAAAAAALAEEKGGRYQPRRVAVDASVWRQREQARFDNGTYRRPLFAGEPWFAESEHAALHFAHVSTETPANIAFTESDERGAADLQTSMRVGRYLERFFADLPRDYRERLTREHMTEFVATAVQITQEADKIQWVYENGPRSCMAHGASYFNSRVHPTTVYAGGDLAIAYMLSEGDENRVASRCVVWPERRIFGRIYGDQRLHSTLTRDGWTLSSDFSGARLSRIVHREAGANGPDFVVPYFDANDFATDNGEHLVVNNMGAVQIKSTNGIGQSLPTRLCSCCNTQVRAANVTSVATGYDLEREVAVTTHYCTACFERARSEGLLTRTNQYGASGYALLAGGQARNGRFYYDNHWEAIETARLEREARELLIRTNKAAAVAASNARYAEAAAAALRAEMQKVARVQSVNLTDCTFVCPATGERKHWSAGVEVRRISGNRRIILRYSHEGAATHTAMCELVRARYELDSLVLMADGRLANVKAAARAAA